MRAALALLLLSGCWISGDDPSSIVACDWRDANGDQLYPGERCELACQDQPPQDGPLCHLGPEAPVPPNPNLNTCHSFVDAFGRTGCCLPDGPIPAHPFRFYACAQ